MFDAGAGQLPEHGNRGIHCSVVSSKTIPIIDIDGIIKNKLSMMFEDPIYANPTSSYLKCYIPLPLGIGTASSLNGSTLQVDYGSTLGKFSVLLLHTPDNDKGIYIMLITDINVTECCNMIKGGLHLKPPKFEHIFELS